MELDTSIIENKQDAMSTMKDIYGYAVFSRDFQEKIESEYKKEEAEIEQYVKLVFTNQPKDEVEQTFQKVIMADMAAITQEDFTVTKEKELGPVGIAGFTILGALFAGGVWLLIEKIRKGKKTRENHNNNRR